LKTTKSSAKIEAPSTATSLSISTKADKLGPEADKGNKETEANVKTNWGLKPLVLNEDIMVESEDGIAPASKRYFTLHETVDKRFRSMKNLPLNEC